MGSEDALKFWMQMLQANTVLGADERKHHGKADLKDVCFQGFSVKGLRLKDLIPKALSWGCIPPISKQKHAEMKFSVLSNFLSCFEISWQLHGEVHLFLQIAPQLKNQRRFCLFFFFTFCLQRKDVCFLEQMKPNSFVRKFILTVTNFAVYDLHHWSYSCLADGSNLVLKVGGCC